MGAAHATGGPSGLAVGLRAPERAGNMRTARRVSSFSSIAYNEAVDCAVRHLRLVA
jgi:hypothetical protein